LAILTFDLQISWLVTQGTYLPHLNFMQIFMFELGAGWDGQINGQEAKYPVEEW